MLGISKARLMIEGLGWAARKLSPTRMVSLTSVPASQLVGLVERWAEQWGSRLPTVQRVGASGGGGLGGGGGKGGGDGGGRVGGVEGGACDGP